MEPKKLYRITQGKLLLGVCGGIAEYFNLDPTLVRIIWVVLALCFGSGVLLYLICALLMPVKPY